MKKHTILFIITVLVFVGMAYQAEAITACDDKPKPAFGCPTGYEMMCIPVGGPHWGCGKEVNGQIITPEPSPLETAKAPISLGEEIGFSAPKLLPTSRWYFLKEWDRGLRRMFAFGAVRKAEVELAITDETVAEAVKTENVKAGNREALNIAVENYTNAQERLSVRLAALNETSENPNIKKLLEHIDTKTEKHIGLLSGILERQTPKRDFGDRADITGDPDFDLIRRAIENAQEKISESVAHIAEKEKDAKQKAAAQIARAEEAVGKMAAGHILAASRPAETVPGSSSAAERTACDDQEAPACPPPQISDCHNGKWICVGPATPAGKMGEPVLPKPTIKPTSGDEPGTAGGHRIAADEPPTPRDRYFFNMDRLLPEAEAHLLRAHTAFAEERYGEAFGQAHAALSLARNILKTYFEQGDIPTEKNSTMPAKTDLRYYLVVKGVPGEAFFREVSGLGSETEVVEYTGRENGTALRKIPGAARYSHIVLKRGLTKSKAFFEWIRIATEKTELKPACTIVGIGTSSSGARRYSYLECFPVSWKMPSLDGSDGSWAIETLELGVGGFSLSKPVHPSAAPTPSGMESPSPTACKIQCLRYDPVCGSNGKTYSCGAAEAECNGIKVVYPGACRALAPSPSKEACYCTQEYAPVCGADGKTYGNKCTAGCARVGVAYLGECRSAELKSSPTPTPSSSGDRSFYIDESGVIRATTTSPTPDSPALGR